MEQHFPATAKDLRNVEGVNGKIRDVAEKAQDVIKTTVSEAKERIHDVKERVQPAFEKAEHEFERSAEYAIARIRERPVTAALAAAGIGLVLGMLLSRRR
jgi:ElaB/YqjD/DUF883 family membrane-anchored ribosome-binding protein